MRLDRFFIRRQSDLVCLINESFWQSRTYLSDPGVMRGSEHIQSVPCCRVAVSSLDYMQMCMYIYEEEIPSGRVAVHATS